MQGNEATRVDKGDIERKSDKNEKLPGGVQKMVGNWDDELLEAALIGDLIRVQKALEKGANPNTKNKDGWTPLHIAAMDGHVDVVRVLLERGANPRIADNKGLIPLDYAKDSVIRSLLESAMRNSYSGVPRMQVNEAARIDNGFLKKAGNWDNELLEAAKNGDLIKVQTALENGANPNAKNNAGQTPLHYAASLFAAQEGRVEIVKLLLKRGADPNAKNKHGKTPLHYAVTVGDVNVVRVLLEHGANPNVKDDNSMTPLHYAARDGHVDVVRVLLEHGADPNTKDNDGLAPLHLAAYLGRVEIVKLLLEHGADPRIADNEGHIPLDVAKDSVIRSLLESPLRNSYSEVPRMQGNEATWVDNGDIEKRKSNENEKLPIVEQSVIKTQGVMQIPNYEILGTIGEGDFAIVYKARRKNGSSDVAIKVPKVPDKDFVKELAVWLNLKDHPNIVKIIDYDINPRPYMVMELMKGGSLHGKTFDKDTATRIILDVLSGLKYAHEKGIIHRDIKPSNILLDDNGRAKISDWGIAKISDITTTNEAYTPIYAAPEQLDTRLGPIDEKTDVYQVCEVFYEILTGRPVFQGDGVYNKKINKQITLPSSINPDLKDYDEIFLKCLSPKKEDRYSTGELISILYNRQYNRLISKTTSKNYAYAFVELAYLVVQYSDNYEDALFWIKKINTVDTKDVISSLEEKIKYNIGTKEDILQKIEHLRKQIGLSK